MGVLKRLIAGKQKKNIVFAGYEFHPDEDITVYELAQIVSIMTMRKEVRHELVMQLPLSMSRYLKPCYLNIETGEVKYVDGELIYTVGENR